MDLDNITIYGKQSSVAPQDVGTRVRGGLRAWMACVAGREGQRGEVAVRAPPPTSLRWRFDCDCQGEVRE